MKKTQTLEKSLVLVERTEDSFKEALSGVYFSSVSLGFNGKQKYIN